jgi:uncharacterized protein (TIGR01244 family)
MNRSAPLARGTDAFALVLAIGLAGCGAGPRAGAPHTRPATTPASPTSPTSPPDSAMSNERIPGLRAPRAGLLTSGQPDPEAWPRLAADGVRAVINLRPDAELDGRDVAAEVAASGLDYLQIPVAGAGDVTTDKATALWHAMRAVDGPVLVHCASGNRVGALMALAAAEHDGMAPEDALAFGRAAGLTSLEPRGRELLGLPAAE